MVQLVSSLLSLMFLAAMLLCLLVAVLWLSYNALQTHSQAVRKSHSAIAAAVKSKTDLVRQLFEIAKEYGAHEQLIHTFVARAEGQPADGPAMPVGRRNSLPTVLIAGRLGFDEAPYFSGDDDMLELFKSDSGEILRATLADFTKTVGETSKRLGTDIGQLGRQLAEYGRTRLDRTLDRADSPDDPDTPDNTDHPTPTTNH